MLHPRPLRVLVVDDHPDGAEALAQLLSLYGHDARAAHSCAEARVAVNGDTGFTPDAILLDVRLSDGDGFTLCAELRTTLASRPVLIALTGLQGLEEKCRTAGFDHYLLKPADPAALLAILTLLAQSEGECATTRPS